MKKTGVRLGVTEQARFCPNCGSEQVHRSRRKTTAEKTLFRLLAIYPYRCSRCDERYFTIGRLPETEGARTHEHASAHAPDAVEPAKTKDKSRAATA